MAATLSAFGDGPFSSCLEVACSEGLFTEMLASDPRIQRLTALDVSPTAVRRTAARTKHFEHVHVRAGDLLADTDVYGPFDLIFCTEVLYYFGASRRRVAHRLDEALTEGGRLVLVHPTPWNEILHRPFAARSALRLVSSTLLEDAVRPLRIEVFEKTNPGPQPPGVRT